MTHFSLFFLLSCWRIDSSVVTLLQPHLCKSAGREGGNIWCIYRDEKQIVQCGHIHSVSAICKNVVHGAETSFTLGCGHWERGDSGENFAHALSCDTVTFKLMELLQEYGTGCGLNTARVLCMARSFSSP
ncbi:unnamed protein product [Arctogadus glacialis]